MLAGNGLEGFRVAAQFLLAVRQMHQRHHSEHHALVTGGEIVQHLAGFLALLLEIIRDNGGEIVVAVLPPLPVGHIGFHAQQAVLHLTHRLVRGDGDHVDGQHERPVQFRQFVDHGVLDVGGKLLEEQDPPKLIAHDEVVLLKFHAVRADGVLVGGPLPHAVFQVKVELCFLTYPVEVVEDPQALDGVQFLAVGVQFIEPAGDIIGNAVKKSSGLIYIFLVGGDGDVPLLHHAVGRVGDLVREHGVVLSPVAVQEIPAGREEDGFLKVLAVEPLVVDGDLGGGAGVQRVEQFGVIQEHRRLVLFGGDGVVDVRKTDALGELAPKLKNPIRPDTANGDGVLYRSWYGKLFLILL